MVKFVPDLFIRVQFRRMRRKKEQPNLLTVLADQSTNLLGLMKRALIGNDNQWARPSMEDLLEKLNIPLAINRLLLERVTSFTGGDDDRQDIITTSPITDRYLRGVAYGSPRATRSRLNPYPRLVLVTNIRPQLRR